MGSLLGAFNGLALLLTLALVFIAILWLLNQQRKQDENDTTFFFRHLEMPDEKDDPTYFDKIEEFRSDFN